MGCQVCAPLLQRPERQPLGLPHPPPRQLCPCDGAALERLEATDAERGVVEAVGDGLEREGKRRKEEERGGKRRKEEERGGKRRTGSVYMWVALH